MDRVTLFLLNRDTGECVPIAADLCWSGGELRQAAESALRTAVHTLKYSRREILDAERLLDAGLAAHATVFVNSPSLVRSLTLGAPPPLAEVPPRARETGMRPLPRPPGFTRESIAARVAQLTELGFPEDDCERALRAAQFNSDRAVDYLLSGSIPEPLVIAGLPPHAAQWNC
jgi:hypothetical protein